MFPLLLSLLTFFDDIFFIIKLQLFFWCKLIILVAQLKILTPKK